jgi:hypothetical protein
MSTLNTKQSPKNAPQISQKEVEKVNVVNLLHKFGDASSEPCWVVLDHHRKLDSVLSTRQECFAEVASERGYETRLIAGKKDDSQRTLQHPLSLLS